MLNPSPCDTATDDEHEQRDEQRAGQRLEADEDTRKRTGRVEIATPDGRERDDELYHDFEVPLEQLEYQIIGLTANLYADQLLNKEGA